MFVWIGIAVIRMLLNVFTFAMFFADKRSAENKEWRVAESSFSCSAMPTKKSPEGPAILASASGTLQAC
jgi:hypothetical protein